MGQLKKAYMAATMDDQGEAPEFMAEYFQEKAEEYRDSIREDGVPDSVRKEALLSNFTDDELRSELNRRWNEEIEQIFKPVLEDLNKIIERLNDGRKQD